MALKKKVPAKPLSKSAAAVKAKSTSTAGAKPKSGKAQSAAHPAPKKPAKPTLAKATPAKPAPAKPTLAKQTSAKQAPAKVVEAARKDVPARKAAAVKPVDKAQAAPRPAKAATPAPAAAPAKAAVATVAAAAASPTARPVATATMPQRPTAVAQPPIAKVISPGIIRTPVPAMPVQPPRTVSSAVPKQAMKTFPAPVTPRDIAAKAAQAHQQQTAAAAAAKKPVNVRHGFKTNEFIVYPAHGVGRIVGIEEQEIAGMSLELFVIQFEKDKMTLRVPTGKLQSVGMRKLADEAEVRKAMETLKGRARIKRTMWSRRAQEYEAKINSGVLIQIAEVVRDLYRSETQPEQSYSERQLYEAALDRMAREIAAVERLDERGAVQRITEVLSKSAKGRRIAAEGAQDNGADVKAA